MIPNPPDYLECTYRFLRVNEDPEPTDWVYVAFDLGQPHYQWHRVGKYPYLGNGYYLIPANSPVIRPLPPVYASVPTGYANGVAIWAMLLGLALGTLVGFCLALWVLR